MRKSELIGDRFRRAIRILDLVNKKIPRKYRGNDGWCGVGAYSNGREQGIGIWVFGNYKPGEDWSKSNLVILFSENRNSDDIVVYHGNPKPGSTYEITDAQYKSAKYFGSSEDMGFGQAEKAASEYILKLIRDFERERRRK